MHQSLVKFSLLGQFTVLHWLMGLGVALTSITVYAQGLPSAAQPMPAGAISKPLSVTHPVAQAAVQAGVRRCAAQIDRVENFLASKQPPNGFLSIAKGVADEELVSLSQGIVLPDNQQAYVSASFAPKATGECVATYETVTYQRISCDQLARSQLSQYKRARDIGNLHSYEIAANAHIFLMPIDSGCISIKKEILRKFNR